MNIKKLFPNVDIVYVTEFGSTLYGTNSANSDIDYKGIFIPKKNDLLLENTQHHLKYSTGDNKSRNTKDDIDIELWSIHKFFQLLKKGETGAIDLLFSMWRKDTLIFEDKKFTKVIKENYELFLTKNFKAFVGYCLGQASKYGIKGSRYGDLLELKEELNDFYLFTSGNFNVLRIQDFTDNSDFETKKYVKVIEHNSKSYLSVLGKLYILDMKLEEFEEKLDYQLSKYGDRTKLAYEGVDWKALSHAVRVLEEMKELVETKFIKFPLRSRDYVLDIKYNSKIEDLDGILDGIDKTLKEVYKLLDNSDLPEEISKENLRKIDEILLSFYK